MHPRAISAQLAQGVRALRFEAPVTHVYNPLDYARAPHEQYLERYGKGPREVLLLGMNPGPWGMAQTGVPFGDVRMVRDWLGIEAAVGKPRPEHPKRPVTGFACTRGEVSGARLWGWAREAFGAPENFFKQFFVANYCPLSFMEAGGRNFTPDKLPARERDALFTHCDTALRALAAHFQPRFLLGIGAFAHKRILAALPDFDGHTGRIPHPSPANPQANRGWAQAAEKALRECGVKL